MDKKFELTDETIDFYGRTLYRIKALKDFGTIKTGDLGGFIQKEDNLSHFGDCWVYDKAKVFGDARVCNNAKVYNNARVYNIAEVCEDAKVFNDAVICDDARIFGNASIYGNARVCGNAKVCDNARVYGDALIYGHAQVFGKARICDDAEIFDKARVCDNAEVFNSAKVFNSVIVCDNAKVYGNARAYDIANVCGNAVLKEDQIVETGLCKVDLSKNLKENIRCQTNLFPQKDYVIAYKQVHKDLTSLYDRTFQYKIGEWAEAEEPEISNNACATGLHFSNVNYWDMMGRGDITYLMAKIMLDDIITVQRGKIRCKRAFILDKYEIED